MKKILLHTCCGPCTTHVNKWLNENGFTVKGLFCNPNIRPPEEFARRLITMEYYASMVGLKVIYLENDVKTEEGQCEDCYAVRLRKTAQMAKVLGFEAFTTTLLISPYQKHALLKQVGETVSLEFGVDFLYKDFRAGYRESRQMARGMKLYMQKY